MENFAILLSIPVAFAASFSYSVFVRFVVAKSEGWTRRLRRVSFAVLAMIALEILLLVIVGAVRLYGATGGLYLVPHLMLFFLGPPALANVIVLRSKGDRVSKIWLVAAIPCTVLALCLVLLQYDVTDRIYGVDGVGGAYSTESR